MISNKLIANAESAATFLTLMGNEKRLLIVSYLIDGEMSVGAIAEKVQLSQSALSQHLAKLRALDLVETRRDRQVGRGAGIASHAGEHLRRRRPVADGLSSAPRRYLTRAVQRSLPR